MGGCRSDIPRKFLAALREKHRIFSNEGQAPGYLMEK
jgi:hypothetical protein